MVAHQGSAGQWPAGDRRRRQDGPRHEGQGREGPVPVAALAHGIGAVLGQVAVDAKSNEIPAAILARQADYVMTVKANMPTLYRQFRKLPWAAVPAVSAVSTDHGRRVRRTIKAALAPAWIEFAGAPQVAQVRRTVTGTGKKTVEVVYLITSSDADPATLAAWARGHWEIENCSADCTYG
jgi:predicted transposase YbfD/YdcC